MRRDQIALQLYTVRDLAQADLMGTIRRVAEIGYPAVEFAGLHGHAAADVRAVLDAVGVRAASAHVRHMVLEEDAEAFFAEANVLGAEYVVISSIVEELRTGDAARRWVTTLNGLGERARAAGLTLGYHNHDFEFAQVDGSGGPEVEGGETLYDLILAETDPALLAMELDIYWVQYGGGEARDLIALSPERYRLLHFKDMTGSGDTRQDAPVGEGSLLLGPIAAGTEGTTAWYIVEQDNPTDPLTDIATSLAGMERLMVG